MLTVKKDNRVLNIDELEKVTFLEDGYDVVEVRDGEYAVVEPATGGAKFKLQKKKEQEIERSNIFKNLKDINSAIRNFNKSE